MNWSQIYAAGRHVASYIAGAVTIAVAFKFLTPSQAADLQTNISVLFDALEKIGTAIAGIAAVLTPIYTAWRAQKSASPIEQAKAVEATGAIVVASPEMAKATPENPGIVSNAEVKVVPK